MANSQPKTEPAIPESVRLERVRKAKGFGDSLWKFWKELCAHSPGAVTATTDEGGNYQISYEAVRNYHDDRHAPGHYYAQVASVFDVRLEWLLGGGGGMTRAEDDAIRTKWDGSEKLFIGGREEIVLTWPDWSDEEKRSARLYQLVTRVPHYWQWEQLPRPAVETITVFMLALLKGKGLDAMVRACTQGEDREPTDKEVAGYIERTFGSPLKAFAHAPFGQQMAAFHSRMATVWLEEFGEDRWG